MNYQNNIIYINSLLNLSVVTLTVSPFALGLTIELDVPFHGGS